MSDSSGRRSSSTASQGEPVRWYRSFYFRFGFTFVLFVVFLIVVQGFVSNAVRMRSPLRGRSPNAVVAIVAADVTALLNQNSNADVDEYLKREYAQAQPIYVVMRDGTPASNRSTPLARDMRRYVDTLLAGSGDPATAAGPHPVRDGADPDRRRVEGDGGPSARPGAPRASGAR